MFVRWKDRQLKPKVNSFWKSEPRRDTAVRWYCQVVESYRQDGKPRQRVIARLGSVLDEDTEPFNENWAPPIRLRKFWISVYEQIDQLVADGTISRKQARDFESTIGLRVKQLTRKDIRDLKKHWVIPPHSPFRPPYGKYGSLVWCWDHRIEPIRFWNDEKIDAWKAKQIKAGCTIKDCRQLET